MTVSKPSEEEQREMESDLFFRGVFVMAVYASTMLFAVLGMTSGAVFLATVGVATSVFSLLSVYLFNRTS